MEIILYWGTHAINKQINTVCWMVIRCWGKKISKQRGMGSARKEDEGVS